MKLFHKKDFFKWWLPLVFISFFYCTFPLVVREYPKKLPVLYSYTHFTPIFNIFTQIYFLHSYICHICDISQLCLYHLFYLYHLFLYFYIYLYLYLYLALLGLLPRPAVWTTSPSARTTFDLFQRISRHLQFIFCKYLYLSFHYIYN